MTTTNDLSAMAQELSRLQTVEARLVAAWRTADTALDSESGLLACRFHRERMAFCEKMLGYKPKCEKGDGE